MSCDNICPICDQHCIQDYSDCLDVFEGMGPTLEEMYHCPAGHYTYHFWTGNIEISIGDQHFELRQNDQDYTLRQKIGDTETAERHKWFQSLEDSNGGQQWLGEPRSL